MWRSTLLTLAALLLPAPVGAKVIRITRDEVRCVSVTRADGTTRSRCTIRRTHSTPPPVALPPALQPLPVPRLELPPLEGNELPCPSIPSDELPGPEIPDAPPDLGDHDDSERFPPPLPPPRRAAPRGVRRLEARVLRLLNAERARRGLGRLAHDPLASVAARAHSRDMCQRHYFDHVTPEGTRPWDRLREAGASFGAAAENIAVGQRTAAQVHQGWLDSPGHRKNRLNPRYTRAGVGLYLCNGTPYWTELFLGPAR